MSRRLLAGCTAIALVAMTGSLYFSEIAGYPPCELCWYQRILMYPLVVFLGVAAYESYAGIWKSGLPISVLGAGIATYHSYLQISPGAASTCTVGGGCGGIYWNGLGIFTIPRLSLLGFLLIGVGLAAVAYRDRNRGHRIRR